MREEQNLRHIRKCIQRYICNVSSTPPYIIVPKCSNHNKTKYGAREKITPCSTHTSCWSFLVPLSLHWTAYLSSLINTPPQWEHHPLATSQNMGQYVIIFNHQHCVDCHDPKWGHDGAHYTPQIGKPKNPRHILRKRQIKFTNNIKRKTRISYKNRPYHKYAVRYKIYKRGPKVAKKMN